MSEAPVIDFKNFTIFPPGRNMPIVYNFNLRVERGSLVALMGGSGCGKTTLMLYLTRRMRNLAHWGVSAESSVYPDSVAFVAQKEMFYPFDTPRNHLLFIRQRHFAETFEESTAAVQKVFELVGLVDEEKQHMQIGEGGRESVLAGGERRLLTVAAALITEPKVVILDEPTTGLDAFTALTVVQQLHAISKKSQTTFVVSIHQPSAQVIATFDSVIHMTPPAGNFQSKPAADDPSIDGDEPGSPVALVTQNSIEAPHSKSVNHLPIGSKVIHLFRLSLWRAVLRTATNWRAGALRVAASLSFALMCSLAWAQLDFAKGSSVPDIIGMALAIIGLSFAPIILNATLFSIERETLLEEHVELSDTVLTCDMLARFISDLILGLFAASAILVSAPIIGIKYTGYFFLTLWMQAWAADSFGGWISMLAPPHVSIGIIIPTVGFLSIALGTGLMQPLIQNEGYIFHVTKWGSFFKYGFQAILLQELPRASQPCNTCLIPTGDAMLNQLHLIGDGYEMSMGFQYLMLFAFTLILRVLAYITLRVLIKSGNRRYHYDRKSAGGAPAPSAAAAAVVDDDTNQSLEHRPERTGKQQIEDCHLLAHRWIMGPVITVPSLVDKVTSKARGTVAEPKRILAVREFCTKPRQLVAIMGPTGCGKSMLLRNMCGRLGTGVRADQPTQFFSSHPTATVQFVDGNDEILPNLQAIEPIAFHLSLFDATLTQEMAVSAAAEQLVALGIPKEKHHNAAYTLSGGQLRRLSVACKSALHPAVLCMDEPTSGLDHIAAVKLGEHLREMSRESCMSIICSLQQPESELLHCFDSFVFMCSGKIAVQGTEEECRAFFHIAADVTDWAEEALYALSRSSVCLAERQEEEGSLQIATPQAAAVPSTGPTVIPCSLFHDPHRGILFCMWELTKRSVLNRWVRAPVPTLVAFLIRYLLLPLCLSILLVQIGKNDTYYFNRSGLIFVYCACVTFSSMLSGAVNFPTQRKMIEEEVKANLYTTTSYLLSQWFTNAIVEDFAGCVLGSIVLKYIAHLNADLGIIIVASFVISQCCDSIGFICGLHRSLSVASGMTVLVLMPFMIGANVITTTAQVTRIPVLYFLEVVSTVRYAYLIIFWSEVKESTDASTALAVFTSYGLRVKDQEKWSEDTTLWPVFCCYMVLLRVVTLLVYRRMICPSCNQ